MNQDYQFDAQNRKFWNEICGTTFAELNKIELKDVSQLSLFDKLYFEFYPYLFDELDWVLEGAKNCVEVGLGAGTTSRYLASRTKEYLGIDISDASCNFVRSSFEFLQLMGKFENRSILDSISVEELNRFDCAVAIGSLHHTGDLDVALKNLELMVKPGGRLLIMIYNYAQPKRILHNPLLFVANKLNVVQKKQFSFVEKSEFIRRASDKNTKGDSAPLTIYSSKDFFMHGKIVKYSCTLKNSHKLGYKSFYIPRNWALKYFSSIFGTDIYARGIKLENSNS